jgi:hypothetical protein
MAYDFRKCDGCGIPLTERQGLSGLCDRCYHALKVAKKPVRVIKPSRGVL